MFYLRIRTLLHLCGGADFDIELYRSVGGIRASNYNAVPPENVQKLVDYMREFAEQNR